MLDGSLEEPTCPHCLFGPCIIRLQATSAPDCMGELPHPVVNGDSLNSSNCGDHPESQTEMHAYMHITYQIGLPHMETREHTHMAVLPQIFNIRIQWRITGVKMRRYMSLMKKPVTVKKIMHVNTFVGKTPPIRHHKKCCVMDNPPALRSREILVM